MIPPDSLGSSTPSLGARESTSSPLSRPLNGVVPYPRR